jgi:hypothetical protein
VASEEASFDDARCARVVEGRHRRIRSLGSSKSLTARSSMSRALALPDAGEGYWAGFDAGGAMRGHHDMGGLPAGPVDRTEHAHAFWEKRVDALMMLLSAPERRLLRVDELRRNIEALPPDAYDSMSYYERWIAAIAATLLQRGVLSADALGRRMEEVAARGDAA